MIGQMVVVEKMLYETLDGYFRRRTVVHGKLAAVSGCWSGRWAASVQSWKAHVERGHDALAWCRPLYHYRNLAWLQDQRNAASSGQMRNRTRTRANRGHPATRWEQGANAAHDALETSRVRWTQ